MRKLTILNHVHIYLTNCFREGFKQKLKVIQKALDDQQKTAHNDAVQYQLSLQRFKHDVSTKDDQIFKLSSDLNWSKNYIQSLEVELKGLRTEIQTRYEVAERWESKAKEEQSKINDLELTRKTLTVQLHNLRQEMNPQEHQLSNLKKRLEEIDAEYLTLLNQYKEKETTTAKQESDITFLQKQVRELRKLAAQKETILRRVSKLFDDYKVAVRENQNSSRTFVIQSIDEQGGSRISGSVSEILEPKDGSGNKTTVRRGGATQEQLELTFSRVDDLLRQYLRGEEIDVEAVNEVIQTREERERHVEHLHRSIDALQTNLDHTQVVSETKVHHRLHDNQVLLKEINELRHEVRHLAKEKQRLEATVEFSERRFRRLQEKHDALAQKLHGSAAAPSSDDRVRRYYNELGKTSPPTMNDSISISSQSMKLKPLPKQATIDRRFNDSLESDTMIGKKTKTSSKK